MSLFIIDGHTLFQLSPNWKKSPQTSRSWAVSTEKTLTGAEERIILKGEAETKLSFSYTVSEQDRISLDEQILSALKSGKAACPVWNNPSSLAQDALDDTIYIAQTGTDWSIERFVFISSGEEWNLREILFVEGSKEEGFAITVDGSLSVSFAKDSAMAFPLFLGKMTVQGSLRSLTPAVSIADLTFSEGIISPAEEDCGCVVHPVIIEKNNQCGSIRISWSRSINATRYRLMSSDTAGGPYTEVITTEELKYDTESPLWRPKFFVCIALLGDVESDPSNEIRVDGLTVENLMRVAQERWLQGHSLPVDDPDWHHQLHWPNRASDGEYPPAYPPDDFYKADLFPGGELNISLARYLVSVIAGVMSEDFLNRYAISGNIEFNESIHVHSVHELPEGGFRQYNEATMPYLTVTEENVEASIREIQSRLCQLRHIVCFASQDVGKSKGVTALRGSWGNIPGTGTPGTDDPSNEARTANAGCANGHKDSVEDFQWNYYGGIDFSSFVNSVECSDIHYAQMFPGFGVICGGNYTVFRYFPEYSDGSNSYADKYGYESTTYYAPGNIGADLTMFERGSAKLFYCVNPGSRKSMNLDGMGGKTYPENKFAEALDVPTPKAGAIYLGENPLNCSNWEDAPLSIGGSFWALETQVIIITKSHIESDHHWRYYP